MMRGTVYVECSHRESRSVEPSTIGQQLRSNDISLCGQSTHAVEDFSVNV